MKKANDPRHVRRIKIVQILFADSFQQGKNTSQPANKLIGQIYSHLSDIDAIITKSAPQFPLPKIAKIDVAVLRLALYEIIYEKQTPQKVIIDEAVELAKEFGGEGSPGFINGVLGYYLKTLNDAKPL